MEQLPMFENEDDLKRYYTIGEVAEVFGVSKSLIRYWEKEFDFLRPHKTGRGDRRFTAQNIEQVRVIYTLVKEQGFTLEGAKRELKERKVRDKERAEWIARLEQIRGFLVELRDHSADLSAD